MAEHEARADTLLLTLAGTIAMLAPQLAQLPPALRARVAGPAPRTLALWHERVQRLRAEALAARAPAAVLHAPKEAAP